MAVMRGTPVLGYHGANAYQVAPYPDGIVEGDLIVCVAGDRYLPSFGAGWSTVTTKSGTNQSGKLAWRIATSADVGAGEFTYILAAAGTGSYAVLAYEAGTFRTADPIASVVDSVAVDINEIMPYLVISAGQTIYHYANARTAAPGTVVSSHGERLAYRNADPDSESALYAELSDSDQTLNTIWTATTASNGSYKASFVVNDPPGVTTLPAITGVAYAIVAGYGVVPVSPAPEEILYTLSPTLVVLADGSPEPFQVQFQTSASPSFGVVTWTQTLTGQVSGQVSIAIGIALTPNVVSYWRARAGDGTSWGPWTPAQALRPMLELTNGQEYLHQNVGTALDVVLDTGEYLHENVGVLVTLESAAGEYLHQNVGFQVVLSRVGGEYLHQYIFIGVPVPHLWFCWRDYGFVNDHVFIYGQGLGTIPTEYHASMRILDSNTALDQAVTVFDWSVNPAGVDAYTDQRRIYKGADAAPPIVNVEAVIVEVTIPSGVATEVAITDYFFAMTDGGRSNNLAFLLYPQIPVGMATTTMTTRSNNVVRLVVGQDALDPIEQLSAVFAPQAFTVVGGMLERPPEHLVDSRSTFTFTGGDTTSDLEDPVGTPVPLGARWRPLTASIVPRPDIGTGVSLWEPVSGSENAWRIENGTDPYILDPIPVPSRQAGLVLPGMVFPGDAWMRSTEVVPLVSAKPSFSFVLVATIYPGLQPSPEGSVLLATSIDGGQPAGTYPLKLILEGDFLFLKSGTVSNSNLRLAVPAGYLSQRPVIVAVRVLPDPADPTKTVASLTILADTLQRAQATIQSVAATSKLYLGRGDTDESAARMDVFDVSLGTSLTLAAETQLLSDLDGAYGVSGT